MLNHQRPRYAFCIYYRYFAHKFRRPPRTISENGYPGNGCISKHFLPTKSLIPLLAITARFLAHGDAETVSLHRSSAPNVAANPIYFIHFTGLTIGQDHISNRRGCFRSVSYFILVMLDSHVLAILTLRCRFPNFMRRRGTRMTSMIARRVMEAII